VECSEHGVAQAATPWSDPGSRFTALFERVVIDWLKEASFSAVARRLGLTWDEVDGIMARAVGRGLNRRGACEPRRIGLDETSFQKRHEYVTVVTDLDGRRLLSVLDGRTKESVDAHFSALPEAVRASVEVVAMDMWKPYMDAAAKWLPRARVCFDRFHVARHLSDAVNTVRKEEHKRLRAAGDRTLVGTKYLWLESPASMRPERRSLLSQLKDVCTRTGRAWALKEMASKLWDYVSPGWARRGWLAWAALASRSKLRPMVRAARMVRTHLEGILNAVVLRATNAAAESMNARIQRIKAMACGYRNRKRFRNAILFHLGGLDLYPRPASAHTIS
jgi:transposase